MVTLGFRLWSKHTPKYLEALGAPVIAVGLYGSLELLASALYQYPAGLLTDKIGSKNALTFLSLLSAVGLAFYPLSDDWRVFLAGTMLVLVWEVCPLLRCSPLSGGA